MGCTYTLTPQTIYVDDKGTSDLNPLSTTPPIQALLSTQPGCFWSIPDHPTVGSFFTASVGIVGDGPLPFQVSVQQNPNYASRTGSFFFLPGDLTQPILTFTVIQFGFGPRWPSLRYPIWNPLWWLLGPGDPFNSGINVNAGSVTDPSMTQLVLARAIAEFASQLTDASASQEILRLAQNFATAQLKVLKNKSGTP